MALASLAGAQISEPSGSSGYKLLKLDVSPRSAALSGAGVSSPLLESDLSPALDTLASPRLSAGWSAGYARFESQIEHAAWATPLLGGTLFGRLRFQGFEGIPGYDGEARPTGTYTASTWAAGLGYGHGLDAILPNLSAGLALHGGMNHVEATSSFAGWTDIGLRWNPGAWKTGAVLRNLGIATRSDADQETLPTQIQIGASRGLPWGAWELSPFLDARWTRDEEWTFPVALEARWGGLYLRTGWAFGLQEARPSFGVGLLGETWGCDASLGWHGALGLAPGLTLSAGI